MKLTGIYCIRNSVNGKCYVGQSRDIKLRFYQHQYHRKSYIGNAITKYGIEAFNWEILELCTEELLDDRECHWIATLNCMNSNGYNLKSGGEEGGRHSEETKQKISETLTGQKHTQERVENIRKSRVGKRLTHEHKQKISTTLKNREFSEEHRKRLSIVNTGKRHTEETRRKLSEQRKGKPGRKQTETAKQKVSKARKGKKLSLEHRKKLSEAKTGTSWSPARRESYERSRGKR